jgi:hypothetical protein
MLFSFLFCAAKNGRSCWAFRTYRNAGTWRQPSSLTIMITLLGSSRWVLSFFDSSVR